MIGSFFTAASGLQAHQTALDIVANDIANVNTPGFKGDRPMFEDLLAQTYRGASAPTATKGGLNPFQVGLGSAVGGAARLMNQGTIQQTGQNTDVAIQGNGYLVCQSGTQQYYSRNGQLSFDANGRLIQSSTGAFVLGWQAQNGTITTTGNPAILTFPAVQSIPPKATQNAVYNGNLNAGATVGNAADIYGITTTVNDSLGNPHDVRLTFTKTAANTWSLSTSTTDPAVTSATLSSNTLTFSNSGNPTSGTTPTLTVTLGNGAQATQTVNLDLTGLTQYSEASNAVLSSQDGYASGQLTSVSIAADGQVNASYSNGQNQTLATLAMASFSNPTGLSKSDSGLFTATPASGTAQIGTANTGNRGGILAGSLEMSNVDLGDSFTWMISAQRGYEANARVMSVADTILQDAVNLGR